MGNIGDESNAIREVVDRPGIPFTPPDELGGDDWNGKFVVFEFECPDGTRQVADPCLEPSVDQVCFDPTDYLYFRLNLQLPGPITSSWYATADYEGFYSAILGVDPESRKWLLKAVLQVAPPFSSVGGTIAKIQINSLTSQSYTTLYLIKGGIGGPGNEKIELRGLWQFSNDKIVIDAEWDGVIPPLCQ
jgi:hypothetical protein